MRDTDNSADVLDIRDLIERIEELRSEQNELIDDYCDAIEGSEERDNAINALSTFWNVTPEEVDDSVSAFGEPADSFKGEPELAALVAFLDEMKGGGGGDHEWEGDWYPVTLVRESHWVDFAQDEAEQLDLVKEEAQWPYTCIDWEKAARELQMDYSCAEFDGVTYWFR